MPNQVVCNCPNCVSNYTHHLNGTEYPGRLVSYNTRNNHWLKYSQSNSSTNYPNTDAAKESVTSTFLNTETQAGWSRTESIFFLLTLHKIQRPM